LLNNITASRLPLTCNTVTPMFRPMTAGSTVRRYAGTIWRKA